MREADFPKVIYVTGIDGSGKTTVSNYIRTELQQRGHEVRVEWLRFNHVLTKPLLGFCRLFGLTRYEKHGDVVVGYHDFYRSGIVSWLFVWLQYLDAVRVYHLKVRPCLRRPGVVLVLDRYVLDILIDVAVDTRMQDLPFGRISRAFRKLVPSGSRIFLIRRNLADVQRARPEALHDMNFEHRYMFYEAFAESNDVLTISNEGSLQQLFAAVNASLGFK